MRRRRAKGGRAGGAPHVRDAPSRAPGAVWVCVASIDLRGEHVARTRVGERGESLRARGSTARVSERFVRGSPWLSGSRLITHE